MCNLTNEGVSKAEDKGRKVMQELLDNLNINKERYYFTEDQLNHIDLLFKNGKRGIEIKYRDIPGGQYFTTGYLLERTKYKALHELKNGNYACIFRDIIIMWDVNKITIPTFTRRLCTETTIDGTYGKKVWKWVTDLRAEEATAIYRRSDFKDIKEEFLTSMEEKEQETKNHLDELISRQMALGLI